jgi:hypothetical protein
VQLPHCYYLAMFMRKHTWQYSNYTRTVPARLWGKEVKFWC